MTAFHQFSSVVMVTVCMETALMTPVIALRTQRVFTAKSCKVCIKGVLSTCNLQVVL